ncbi:MAG TPA: ABC transporter ATP-binding protein [Baekduia sp.]|nr:ABC transporter ATP-binding protein [Baekduia sp.]
MEEAFAGMVEDLRVAAADPAICERLRTVDVSVGVRVAECPDLACVLRFDHGPLEVVTAPDGAPPADVELTVPAARLDGLWDQPLPALILDGSVAYRGPVSRLLRVVPLLRSDAGHIRATAHLGAEAGPPAVAAPPASGLTPGAAALLDRAAAVQDDLHRGAPGLCESSPGEFWSIECVGVHKRFGDNRVLAGLDLGIPEGMITVVMGPSGTGKSVLIKHLVGLLFPDAGEIRVHGQSVSRMRRSQLLALRQRFGILFQDGALFGSMPVYDNVAFPLRQHTDFSEAQIREIVQRRLAEVGLGGEGARMPNELSGGMRKRAGFARALVLEPEIVLFDEPDSGLDPVRTALLCELIRKMHVTYGGTYLVITHDVASARQIGDYIAVLWKGRIVEAGPARRMFASENPFVRQFLNRAPQGPLGME